MLAAVVSHGSFGIVTGFVVLRGRPAGLAAADRGHHGESSPVNTGIIAGVSSDEPLVPFDAGKPNVARAYEYVLGGKDNFAPDRELAIEIGKIFPLLGVMVRENRDFLGRAVEYVSRQGVAQFIDVGSGLPSSPNVHEMARQVDPGARVAYVDNDPMVISHISALLTGRGNVAAVPGDVRRPDAILSSAELTAMIDLTEPACVIMAMVTHFFEPAEAEGIVAAFVGALAPGSFLVISEGVNNDPSLAERLAAAFTPGTFYAPDRKQLAGYFGGLEMVEPGLVEARYWRSVPPGTGEPGDLKRPADLLAGVGRKAG
jgi:hypothetical protein